MTQIVEHFRSESKKLELDQSTLFEQWGFNTFCFCKHFRKYINDKGDCIYHIPGTSEYVIMSAVGEIMFDSNITDAQQAYRILRDLDLI